SARSNRSGPTSMAGRRCPRHAGSRRPRNGRSLRTGCSTNWTKPRRRFAPGSGPSTGGGRGERAQPKGQEERMKAAYLKVLRELLKKPPVPREIAEKHGDIEDAIAEAGGTRGAVGRG